MNPRSRKFAARFSINVTALLGADPDKKPRYLMTTGAANFRGGGPVRPAASVVYVVDANTGNFAAYQVPWNPQAWATNNVFMAPLVPCDVGRVRNVQVGE